MPRRYPHQEPLPLTREGLAVLYEGTVSAVALTGPASDLQGFALTVRAADGRLLMLSGVIKSAELTVVYTPNPNQEGPNG